MNFTRTISHVLKEPTRVGNEIRIKACCSAALSATDDGGNTYVVTGTNEFRTTVAQGGRLTVTVVFESDHRPHGFKIEDWKNCGEAVIKPESSEDLWPIVEIARKTSSMDYSHVSIGEFRNLLRVIDALKRERDEAVAEKEFIISGPPAVEPPDNFLESLPDVFLKACETHPVGMTECKRCGDLAWGWTPISTPPTPCVPIEMTGDSGYVKPHDRFVISGSYVNYGGREVWRDSTGTQTAEMGWNPTHWRYLTPGPR